MKKLILLSVITLSLTLSLSAQYQVKSEYINNPELLIDYADDCAIFWEGVHDDAYGGFFVEVGRSGNILNYNNKSLVSQSRDAYGFTRAFMLTGKTEYLDDARSALDFMYDHLWDEEYGGWFKRSLRNGDSPYTGEKSAFDQHYALLGITAYFEATQNPLDLEMLKSGYNFNDASLWDDNILYTGYFDGTNRMGSFAYNKSFNATVDAITTHVYSLYLLTGEQKYLDRLLALKNNIQDNLFESMANQKIGFAESYNSLWQINENEKRTIMGHVLKTAWCMGRIYRIENNDETLQTAKYLAQDVLDKGYDHELGGPYKDYDRTTGEMYMYGASDTAKAWWQMEQAVTSGFMLYEISGEDKYLQMADESLDFFMNYFVDPVYGEIYADRNRQGGKVPGWDENKGSEWKAAYHSIETAYYSYLYSKLLIKQENATLYYKFDASTEDKTITLNPLALNFNNLTIDAVKLNGNDYSDFNANDRKLFIPHGIGGVFAVSFKYSGSPYAVDENVDIADVSIYPNPFVEQINVEFVLKKDADVSLEIYNSIGQKVENSSHKFNAGLNKLIWNNSYGKGVYFLKFRMGDKYKSFKIISR